MQGFQDVQTIRFGQTDIDDHQVRLQDGDRLDRRRPVSRFTDDDMPSFQFQAHRHAGHRMGIDQIDSRHSLPASDH
ncbi:MAG: hypothetical protein GAK36_00292 [Pseudomonas sp.]|nr:MAG: hypothetical protein GAK36_00292 [Pseudomonas sp.]